jgi:DNA modification methylase/ParB-like chromosome segregation protein Spo0J
MSAKPQPRAEVAVVPFTSIIEGTRFRVDYGDINELVASFKVDGIIQPLAVRDNGDGTYTLAAGGRRYRAAGLAEIADIPVRVYPQDIDEYTMRSIELMENIIRKDLAWHEMVLLKKEIHELQVKIYGTKISTSPDAPGWSKAMTAKLLGGAESMVSEDIKLAEAMEILPDLKKAKNRNEAQKILRSAEEGIIRAELAKRMQENTATTGVERVHRELINRYIVGDFFDVVKQIPDKSVDIIELDPPYGIDLHDAKTALDNGFYPQGNYNEVAKEKYEEFMTKVLSECNRVMSENSWLICWFAMEPWVDEIYHMISATGLKTTRLVALWEKATGQTRSPSTQLASTYEPFFYARKGNPLISKQGRGNIFRFKGVNSSRKIHPTERPIELIQEVLATFGWQSARVFVPFLGSGNTILSAANLGMQAFGCDLTQEYKDSYIIKVTGSAPGSYHSYREGVKEDDENGDEG